MKEKIYKVWKNNIYVNSLNSTEKIYDIKNYKNKQDAIKALENAIDYEFSTLVGIDIVLNGK